jgi:hypothetical protein
MGYKPSKSSKTVSQPDRVLIKYVRKAKMFARTEFKDGKQTITWHEIRPE